MTIRLLLGAVMIGFFFGHHRLMLSLAYLLEDQKPLEMPPLLLGMHLRLKALHQ